MTEFDFPRLARIGLTPLYLQQILAENACGQLMRISAVHRDSVQLHDGEQEHLARLLPASQTALQHEAGLAVGDWVLARRDEAGSYWLQQRIAPQTALLRRDSHGQRQRIASNIDTALLVMGLDGDFNLRRLERFVSMVVAAGITPVVVLSKADLYAPELVAERLAAVQVRLGRMLNVLALDGSAEASRQLLSPWLGQGQTLVLLGSSGAGKSTLANTLIGAARQLTGAVRSDDSRGRHTTTARSLHPCQDGSCLIDTPGVRTLQPDLDEDALAQSFADIEALAADCQFRDCRHQQEPGCAVRASVDADRLGNYHKLMREARRLEQSALERKAEQAVWKQRSKAIRQIDKRKGRA